VGRLKIGVFGGTFDPVHLGHLIFAEQACYQLNLEKILWVLTPNPPHKGGQAVLRWEDRLQLLTITLADEPIFEISLVDILREPPQYAADTLSLLKKQYINDQLIYLMGSDSLRDLPGWYHPQELVEICDTLAIMHRSDVSIDNDKLEQFIPGIHKKLVFLPIPRIDISSSDIRSRISQSKPYRYFLPRIEYEYIRQYQLYRIH
jgi:nicotinate-nucleotide adenylyltransferase